MQIRDHFTIQCQQQKIPSVKLAHGNVDCPFPLVTALLVLVMKTSVRCVAHMPDTNSTNLLYL